MLKTRGVQTLCDDRSSSNLAERLECERVQRRFPRRFVSDQKHGLCKWSVAGYLAAMSAAEILNELPKLTEADRRAIRQLLLELAEKNDDVAACNQAALDGAIMLDRMEDEDARRQSR